MSAPKRRGAVVAIASTRGQLARVGLLVARNARGTEEQVMFLDMLGVTEALDLPLPVAPSVPRYAYGPKRRLVEVTS